MFTGFFIQGGAGFHNHPQYLEVSISMGGYLHFQKHHPNFQWDVPQQKPSSYGGHPFKRLKSFKGTWFPLVSPSEVPTRILHQPGTLPSPRGAWARSAVARGGRLTTGGVSFTWAMGRLIWKIKKISQDMKMIILMSFWYQYQSIVSNSITSIDHQQFHNMSYVYKLPFAPGSLMFCGHAAPKQ